MLHLYLGTSTSNCELWKIWRQTTWVIGLWTEVSMHPCKMYIIILYMYLYSSFMLLKIIWLFSTLRGLAQRPRTDIQHTVLITILTNQSERSLRVVAKRYQHVYEVSHYELLILNFCFFTKSWAILSPVRVSKVWRIGWSGINITKEKGKGMVCMRNVCCWHQTSFKNVSCLKWMGGGQTYWPHWNAVYSAADLLQFMSTLMINIRSANGILHSIVHTIH